MIYVFGSNHLDTKELPEIKSAFRRLGQKACIGIELANDRETRSLLDNISAATESEIRKVIRKHYGGPPSGAYHNLLKFISKNRSSVGDIFIIEPKDTKVGRRLNKKMWKDARLFEDSIKSKGHKDTESLLNMNLRSIKATVEQCEYRENGMRKIIKAHINHNSNCNIFIYCGMFHQPYITNYLDSVGERYSTRSNVAAKGAVRYITGARGLAKKRYETLTHAEKLSLAHSALEDSIYLYHNGVSMQQYYNMLKKIRVRVKSIKDFEKATANLQTFIKRLA